MRASVRRCLGVMLVIATSACAQGASSHKPTNSELLAVHVSVPTPTLEVSCKKLTSVANAQLQLGTGKVEGQVCRWQSPRHLLLLNVDKPASAADAFTAWKRLGVSRMTSVAGRDAFFANQGQLVVRVDDRLLFLAATGMGANRETVEQRVAAALLQ